MAKRRRNSSHYGFANEETFSLVALLTGNPEYNTSIEDLYADAVEETKNRSRAQKVLAQMMKDFMMEVISDDPDTRPTPVLRRRMALLSLQNHVNWDEVSKYWIAQYDAENLDFG